MELTELDFTPPTGPEGQEFLINGEHKKFTNAEWVSVAPVKEAPAPKTPATK